MSSDLLVVNAADAPILPGLLGVVEFFGGDAVTGRCSHGHRIGFAVLEAGFQFRFVEGLGQQSLKIVG